MVQLTIQCTLKCTDRKAMVQLYNKKCKVYDRKKVRHMCSTVTGNTE